MYGRCTIPPLTFDHPAICKASWRVGETTALVYKYAKHTRKHMFMLLHVTFQCFTLPWGLNLGPPASEGRSLPTGLWVQLPSGPPVPPLVSLLSHLASAVGKAP